MANVLYITANPNAAQTSFSLAVGEQFIDAYREANPADEIIHLNLFEQNVPQLDAEVFGAWGLLQSGTGFDQLSSSQQEKIGRLGAIVDQFVAADKYVFVTPMWNFSFPPVMKAYIDAVSVAGKTFKYSENGPVGLLTNKKALHIQASGGVYSHGPAAAFENGVSYLGKIMQFFGVPTFEAIFVEGMAATPDKAQEIKENAIVKAKEAAKRF